MRSKAKSKPLQMLNNQFSAFYMILAWV